MTEGPIYITGLDRSGKTTMRALLASHSRIAIPAVGSNMWMYFYERFGDLDRPANLDRCLDAMLSYKHVAFLQPDEAEIRAEFARGPRTYARLFAIFLEAFARREGKPRWGAQSGLEEQYADEMFAAYPGLKMIQMVRDPRDRYAASLEKWPDGKGRAGGAAARWSYSMAHAERNLRSHSDDYLVVRFEDLVKNTRQVMEEVCAFLGEPFEEPLLEMTGAAKHRALLAGGAPEGHILSSAFIGIHSDLVPVDELAFLEWRLGAIMRRWRYDTPPRPRVRSARWWLRVVPDQMVRMVAWRMVEEVNRRFPVAAGRRPGRRMIVERVGSR
jgi:hypothetical protein